MTYLKYATVCSAAVLMTAQTVSAQLPKYQLLRQNEDWSKYSLSKDSKDHWTCGRLKNIRFADRPGSVTLGGLARYRYEDWDHLNFGNATTNNGGFAVWNVFLHADIKTTENSRVFIEGKFADANDRNLAGGRRTADVDHGALQQAFVDYTINLPSGNALTLRPGRQMFAFGKQRLVSPLPWLNTYRAWDGLSAFTTYKGWKATALATQFVPVRKYQFNRPSEDRQFNALYVTGRTFGKRFNHDFYWLQDIPNQLEVAGFRI